LTGRVWVTVGSLALARRQGGHREGLAGTAGPPGGGPKDAPKEGGGLAGSAGGPGRRGLALRPCRVRRWWVGVGRSIFSTNDDLGEPARAGSGSQQHAARERPAGGHRPPNSPPGGNPQGAQRPEGRQGNRSEAEGGSTSSSTRPNAVADGEDDPGSFGARSGPICAGWCGPNGPRRGPMNEANRAGVVSRRGHPTGATTLRPQRSGGVDGWASWVLTLSKLVARVGV